MIGIAEPEVVNASILEYTLKPIISAAKPFPKGFEF
jgi:hypothetical protein